MNKYDELVIESLINIAKSDPEIMRLAMEMLETMAAIKIATDLLTEDSNDTTNSRKTK